MKSIDYLNLKDINLPYETPIKAALNDVVNSGWYLFGENVSQFENEWREYCHAGFCVSCGNGLDALRLVLMAWMEMGRLAEGDEVIVPANTYIASILAVSDCGLRPVFVEPDSQTYLITTESITKALTHRTRVILPVHLYGQYCEMAAIRELAQEKNLMVLEDCAQCHSSQVQPSRSSALAFSFYPGKNLGALGDAGAVVTDDCELAETVRKIANYGSLHKYVHECKGLNSRMDEFQAAVLRIKLRDLDRSNSRRLEIASLFDKNISNEAVILPKISTFSVYHIYPVRCQRRDELQAFLKENNISTQIHYPVPPHRQSAYREFSSLSLPITEELARTELSLPCNQAMTDDDVKRVIDAVNNFK